MANAGCEQVFYRKPWYEYGPKALRSSDRFPREADLLAKLLYPLLGKNDASKSNSRYLATPCLWGLRRTRVRCLLCIDKRPATAAAANILLHTGRLLAKHATLQRWLEQRLRLPTAVS